MFCKGVASQPSNVVEARQVYKHTEYVNRPVENNLLPELKSDWIKALRSGDYEQGRKVLTQVLPDGKKKHCCLGVLCDMHPDVSVASIGSSFRIDVNDEPGTCVDYKFPKAATSGPITQSAVLDWEFAGALGMNDSGVFYVFFKLWGEKFFQETSLTTLNDTGFTFDQIADVIEYFF